MQEAEVSSLLDRECTAANCCTMRLRFLFTMKPHFVSDGKRRLRSSREFETHLRELRESIQARYADEFARAGFLQRMILRWRIATEFRRERRKIEPSPASLYSSRIAT
jgi:hypothetical protein